VFTHSCCDEEPLKVTLRWKNKSCSISCRFHGGGYNKQHTESRGDLKSMKNYKVLANKTMWMCVWMWVRICTRSEGESEPYVSNISLSLFKSCFKSL
jgi:hypothetical protein